METNPEWPAMWQKYAILQSENIKARNCLSDTDKDGRIILKCSLIKCTRTRIFLTSPGHTLVLYSSEEYNE